VRAHSNTQGSLQRPRKTHYAGATSPREVLDGNPPARHPSPASPTRTTTAGDDRVALQGHADGVDLGARAGPRVLDPVGTLARNRRTRIGLVDRRLGAIRQRALRRALQAGGQHHRLRHPDPDEHGVRHVAVRARTTSGEPVLQPSCGARGAVREEQDRWLERATLERLSVRALRAELRRGPLQIGNGRAGRDDRTAAGRPSAGTVRCPAAARPSSPSQPTVNGPSSSKALFSAPTRE
jgi:hypothetical protein